MDPQHLISNIGILVIQPSAPFGHIWKYTGGGFRSSSERHEVIQGRRFPLLFLLVLRCSFYGRRFPCVVLHYPEFLYVLRFTFDLLHVSLCVLAFASFYFLRFAFLCFALRFPFTFCALRCSYYALMGTSPFPSLWTPPRCHKTPHAAPPNCQSRSLIFGSVV